MLQRRGIGRRPASLRPVGKGPITLKGPQGFRPLKEVGGLDPAESCAYCGDRCGTQTYAELRDGKIEHLFCSLYCFRAGTGTEDEIKDEVARQVRKELNWLHHRVCGRCQHTIQEVHRRMQTE